MKDDKRRFKDLIENFHTAMLVTQPGEHMHARPMAVARIDDDGTMWFISGIDTSKVDEILQDSHAAVTMQSATTFVSISGTCRIFRDDQTLDKLWSKSFDLWLQHGKRDAVAIELRPIEAEFWSHEMKGLRFMFEAARAALKGSTVRPSKVGNHAYISLGGRPTAH